MWAVRRHSCLSPQSVFGCGRSTVWIPHSAGFVIVRPDGSDRSAELVKAGILLAQSFWFSPVWALCPTIHTGAFTANTKGSVEVEPKDAPKYSSSHCFIPSLFPSLASRVSFKRQLTVRLFKESFDSPEWSNLSRALKHHKSSLPWSSIKIHAGNKITAKPHLFIYAQVPGSVIHFKLHCYVNIFS